MSRERDRRNLEVGPSVVEGEKDRATWAFILEAATDNSKSWLVTYQGAALGEDSNT